MQNIHFEVDKELDNTQKLWRYMDLSKFISLLNEKALWLARVDTFRDKQEGRFPDEMRKIFEKFYTGFEKEDVSPIKSVEDFLDFVRKNTFISCWHKNSDENMVMWEIYGRDTKALAIQTTVERFKNSIDPSNLFGNSLLLKNVLYQQAEQISGMLRREECYFIKRPHYSHEAEARICLDVYSDFFPTKDTPQGYYLPVLINGLIEKILIHPDSPDGFMDDVKSITKKFNVHAPLERGLYGTK